MLYHHDARDYQTAASAAATAARSLMERKIEKGRASAVALLEHVHTAIPSDAVVRGRATHFVADHSDPGLFVTWEKNVGSVPVRRVHRHALGHVASYAGVPAAYLRELSDSPDVWKRELAARIANDHFHQNEQLSETRLLTRSVPLPILKRLDYSDDGFPVEVQGPLNYELRAMLSDRYRRLDSRPLLEAFAGECQAIGAVPVEGTVTDTRVALKAFLPMVFEPVPNEVMCLGIEWSNSDFGSGKHALRAFIFRLWCSNGAVMEDSLSQVHLGGRLADSIELSDRTYELDTSAQVSALRDIVKGVLGPAKVGAMLDTIREADEKKVEWKSVNARLSSKLLKGELKAVKDAFESDDVINLPAAKSVWRASNAVSWIAGQTEDADRKLELQRLAGEIIHGKVEKPSAS